MSFLTDCNDNIHLDDALADFNMPHFPKMPMRKQGCTHTKVTRTYGKHKCFHCGKVPAWGWVYRCVQDWERLGIKNVKDLLQEEESGQLSSIVSEQPKAATEPFREKQMISPDAPAKVENLKVWVQKAIAKGEYTDDQVQTLLGQRENLERIRVPELAENSAMSGTTKRSQTDPDAPRMKSGDQIRGAKDYCRYQACAACRPNLRDRAWESIDRILEDDYYARFMASMKDQENPRPSDPAIARQLGLHPVRDESSFDLDMELDDAFESEPVELESEEEGPMPFGEEAPEDKGKQPALKRKSAQSPLRRAESDPKPPKSPSPSSEGLRRSPSLDSAKPVIMRAFNPTKEVLPTPPPGASEAYMDEYNALITAMAADPPCDNDEDVGPGFSTELAAMIEAMRNSKVTDNNNKIGGEDGAGEGPSRPAV